MANDLGHDLRKAVIVREGAALAVVLDARAELGVVRRHVPALGAGREKRNAAHRHRADLAGQNVLDQRLVLAVRGDEDVDTEHAGKVIWLSTEDIVRIAREAGAPKEKGAGLVLHSKLGDSVHKDSVLFEIYAERSSKLASALELAKQLSPIALTKKPAEKMILDQVPEKLAHEKTFMLDR